MSEPEPINYSRRSGFTLAEILLAMLVFSIAITTILALLARSIETVDEIVLKDEAMRLSSAVEQQLMELPFNDLYASIYPDNVIEMRAFHFRANNDDDRDPQPNRAIEDVVILPFAQPVGVDPDAEFAARDGRYFRVRLQLSPTNPTPLTPLADNYPSAALVLFAEFIPLAGPSASIPASPRIVYSYNFAVRR
jgi:prepilin-type N-terminal cleavage/methylation domain-containing protein